MKKGLDASVPGKSMELNFILRDANWKQVAEQKATTDEYGTASVDFEAEGVADDDAVAIAEIWAGAGHDPVESG